MSGSDPVPRNDGDAKQETLSPELQREALKIGLEGWSKKVIDNDDLFCVIQSKLEEGGEYDPMMTDFSIEPTMRPQEDGSRLWGIRIAESAKTKAGAISVSLSFFKHIDVARFDPEARQFHIEPSFAQAITTGEGDTEDKKKSQPAVEAFLNCTMGMLNKLSNDGVELSFDLQGKLITDDELGRMARLE